jgi:outer membrane protein OmpA-like peptidoglycan-associated protein
VWVVVGIGAFFVLIALGITAVVVVKGLGMIKFDGGSSARESKVIEAAPSNTSTSGKPGQVSGQATGEGQTGAPMPVPSADSKEVDDTRQEVLKRIDLMPDLSQKEKDQLYAQVERARGFSKIGVVPFSTAKSALGASQIEAVAQQIRNPKIQQLLQDPTVVLVMVGYADKQGDQVKNREISRTRAEAVVKAIKDRLNPMNIMHAVGMGGQDLFGTTLDKNRVVEIWAVQP